MTIRETTTLLEFLFQVYPDSPRTRVKQILQGGSVSINGYASTLHKHPLKPGDIVEIGDRKAPDPFPCPFPILAEGSGWLAIDKPVGIATSSEDGQDSVYKKLQVWAKQRSKNRDRVWVVHRLDKEVSGVLLFAKNEETMEKIKSQWPATEKVYHALVEGKPREAEGTIHNWIKESDEKGFTMKIVAPNSADAKEAITHYRTLKNLGDYTLLEIKLETGRKNQIRVHLAGIACPIVGDRRYGADDSVQRRIRLHAVSLSFPDPETTEPVVVTSGLPADFSSLKPGNEKYK